MDQAGGCCFLRVLEIADFKYDTDGRPYREAKGRENDVAIAPNVM